MYIFGSRKEALEEGKHYGRRYKDRYALFDYINDKQPYEEGRGNAYTIYKTDSYYTGA